MSIKCTLGFHSWEGCRCRTCRTVRDEQHDWRNDCETCAMCGKSRTKQHDFTNDCEACSKCNKINKHSHNWNEGDTCTKCGKTQHDVVIKALNFPGCSIDFLIDSLTDQDLLTKVAYEAKAWSDRWNAVKKIDDQQVLAKVAISDKYSEVRLTAIDKLENQKLLEEISKSDQDKNVRERSGYRLKSIRIAIRNNEINSLTDQSELARIATEDPELENRIAAVKKLTDRSLLTKFTTAADDWRIRLAALEQLDDPTLLAKAAMEDKNSYVRKFVVKNPRLSLPSLVEIAKNEMDEDVYKDIFRRFFDENALRELSQNAKSSYVRTVAAEKLALPAKTQDYIQKVLNTHGEQIGDWIKKLFDLYDKSPAGEGYSRYDEGRKLIVEIGEEIYSAGGLKLMLQIHQLFAGLRHQQARNLELSWNGIGEWQG